MKQRLLTLMAIGIVVFCGVALHSSKLHARLDTSSSHSIRSQFVYAEEASPQHIDSSMVIEWLKIKVAPENLDLFIEADDKIWTPALAQYPGFIDKTTWLNPADLSEIVLVIYWETREQWKAIPAEALDSITQAFEAVFPFDYEMIEEKEYIPQEL